MEKSLDRIYLSRRNLLTLLSKLDRRGAGDQTYCTIIKYRNPADPPEYQQTMDSIVVTAVEDDEYYTARQAGAVVPQDDPGGHEDETEINFLAKGLFPHRPKSN